MMMPMVIDHHRHMHDFFLRHGHGYLNDLFNGLLNNTLLMVYLAYDDDFFFLLRVMVIDYHVLFDMMMTLMMHYSGNEDHLFLCHRHWDRTLTIQVRSEQVRSGRVRSSRVKSGTSTTSSTVY